MRNRNAFVYSSLIIGFLLIILSLSYVYSSYKADRERIVDRLHLNASFVDLWLTKSFNDSSFVLKDMVNDLSVNGLHTFNENKLEHNAELSYLREKEDALPNATQAFIVDNKCKLTHSKTLNDIDLSEREYCKVFKKNQDQELVVTLPFRDLQQRNVVVQGHKIIDDDGNFAGMVGISTNLNFLIQPSVT